VVDPTKVWRDKQEELKAEADNTTQALQEYMTVAGKEVEGIDDDSIEVYALVLKAHILSLHGVPYIAVRHSTLGPTMWH
jgi:hypothetical protein